LRLEFGLDDIERTGDDATGHAGHGTRKRVDRGGRP
jgi:hypothetical protein